MNTQNLKQAAGIGLLVVIFGILLSAVSTRAIAANHNEFPVPPGAIILFEGDSCPTGWHLKTAYIDRFLAGGTTSNPDAGGSDRHIHNGGSYKVPSHIHGPGSYIWTNNSSGLAGGEPRGYGYSSPGAVGITGNSAPAAAGQITGTSAPADSRPRFSTLLVCGLNSTPADPPDLEFSASPATIQIGNASTLDWSAHHVTACTATSIPADPSWTGNKATIGTQAVSPSQSTAYTLECTGDEGEITATVTVDVTSPPPSQINLEMETNAARTRIRSNASEEQTAYLLNNESTRQVFAIEAGDYYAVTVRYSDDSPFLPPSVVEVSLDGTPIGQFQSVNTRPDGASPGDGWNCFQSASLGIIELTRGRHEVIVSVLRGDPWGIEVDILRFTRVGENHTEVVGCQPA